MGLIDILVKQLVSDIFASSELDRTAPIEEGGAGSGNFDHAGRPGEVGGSGEGDNRAEVSTELSSEEHSAMRYYAERGGYQSLNRALRLHPGDMIDEDKAQLKALDKLTSRKIPEDMVVYRGVQTGLIDKLKVGSMFKDKGFVSTSKSLNTASHFGYWAVKIHVPSGSKGFYIGSKVGQAFREQELLLARGCKFRVDKIGDATGGHNVVAIEVTLVGQNER